MWTVRLYRMAFLIENVQIWRGLDPRFTMAGFASDKVLGVLFFAIAFGIAGTFINLVVKFFKYLRTPQNASLVLGIQYGSGAVILSFLIGGFIGAMKGAVAIGIHALQALPVLGWILMKTKIKPQMGRLLMHVNGGAWLVALGALIYQLASGHLVGDWTIATIISAAGLGVWLATTLIVSLLALLPVFENALKANGHVQVAISDNPQFEGHKPVNPNNMPNWVRQVLLYYNNDQKRQDFLRVMINSKQLLIGDDHEQSWETWVKDNQYVLIGTKGNKQPGATLVGILNQEPPKQI